MDIFENTVSGLKKRDLEQVEINTLLRAGGLKRVIFTNIFTADKSIRMHFGHEQKKPIPFRPIHFSTKYTRKQGN